MNYRSHPFPWKHYTFENFFEQDDFEKIKNIQINNADYSEITGFRDVIKGRTFLNNEAVDNDNTLLSAAKCLNRKEYFGECFKVDLKDTYMRAEIIHDRYPFFHDVHVDLPCKNLTIILNIDKEDDKNLATDLYHSKDKHAKKLDWVPNGGVAFKIEDHRWHGFAPTEYKGIRKIMIVNYVNIDEWRDKDQLFIE
tara:strand:- start:73 stop:657 length:585 start_codon:yes stop_codon:yes gene_type:complete